MPLDKGMPLMRKDLWRIGSKCNTGDKVFTEYMNENQNKKDSVKVKGIPSGVLI